MSRPARRTASGLQKGDVVADRYRIEGMLGEGGMAEVFEVTDLETSEPRALKLLHPQIATKQEAVERTMREGQLLSELNNPAIVSVERFGKLADGRVYLVMELLDGETLGKRMQPGPMEPDELSPIVTGTCAGLHAAHVKGVVHRDLKPENIFLCPTKFGVQVKLLDFGISKVLGSARLTQTGEVLGTPRYMSPEQLGAEKDVDGRIDTYSLGVILYEALAGRAPFTGTTPTDLIVAILHGNVVPLRAVRSDIPKDVERVVMRAFANDRDLRFPSARDLAEAYVDAVGSKSTIRKQPWRSQPTRAFGEIKTAEVSTKQDLPSTRRPPPAPEPIVEPIREKLDLGTFDETLDPDASTSPSRAIIPPLSLSDTPIDDRVRGRGAAPNEKPESEGAEASEETAAREETAAHDNSDEREGTVSSNPPGVGEHAGVSSKEIKRDTAFPSTRETPRDMVDAALESIQKPSPRRSRVPETALMDPSSLTPPPSQPRLSAVSIAGSTPPLRPESSGHVPILQRPVDPRSIHPRSQRPTTAPSRGLRNLLLVLGALVAGALSASAVIAALHFLTGKEDTGDGTPEPEVDEEPDVDVPESPHVDPEPETLPTGVDTPTGPVAPGAQAADEERPNPEAPVVRRPPRRRPDVPTATEDANDPIREAQTALRNGDPERCIALLDDAIRHGTPTSTLRRRAECHEAAGHRSAAISDYQRFCRLAPDHPAIADVRTQLAEWRATCP